MLVVEEVVAEAPIQVVDQLVVVEQNLVKHLER